MPNEKDERYTLYVVDRYRGIVQILDPNETSVEEEEKAKKLWHIMDTEDIDNINDN